MGRVQNKPTQAALVETPEVPAAQAPEVTTEVTPEASTTLPEVTPETAPPVEDAQPSTEVAQVTKPAIEYYGEGAEFVKFTPSPHAKVVKVFGDGNGGGMVTEDY